MAHTLSELLGELGTERVIVRGREVTIRPVTAAESLALERQWPRPATPPGREAEAAASPAFRETIERYWIVRRCALVAIGAGIADRSGEAWSPARDRRWLEGLADEMCSGMSEAEIARLYEAQISAGVTLRCDEVIGPGANSPPPGGHAGLPGGN